MFRPHCFSLCFILVKESRYNNLNMSSLKIALVHDYLRDYGGAERVLEALHELYPEAPVYTAFIDRTALGSNWDRFKTWDLRETWLGRIPGFKFKKLFSPLRFLAPKAFADLDLSNYEVVISSSNAYFAKAVHVPNGRHLCYCHTPPRALYGYTAMSDWKKHPLIRIGGEIINHYLRVRDFQIAQKVDVFIANSHETARRIQKFYRRESFVIYPPVGFPKLEQKKSATTVNFGKKEYFLSVNRLALAKHPEIAVAACLTLDLPLKVVGDGPMLIALKNQVSEWQMAHPNSAVRVEFLGAVVDAELQTLYAEAKALLYPVEDEDFGMVPVEAMLAGTPVIAHNSGGPRETVLPGLSGVLFDELSTTGLIAAIQDFSQQTFSTSKISQQAAKFSKAAFMKAIPQLVARQLQ